MTLTQEQRERVRAWIREWSASRPVETVSDDAVPSTDVRLSPPVDRRLRA